jgi:mRNA-degrading endonuclease YafQ of YafQ-DinJ toxin-antitoxin module
MILKTTDIFKKSFKRLLKKDRSLLLEYEKLLNNLEDNITLGKSLGVCRTHHFQTPILL